MLYPSNPVLPPHCIAANDPTPDHALRRCLQRCAFLLDSARLVLPDDTAREAAAAAAAEARRLLARPA